MRAAAYAVLAGVLILVSALVGRLLWALLGVVVNDWFWAIAGSAVIVCVVALYVMFIDDREDWT